MITPQQNKMAYRINTGLNIPVLESIRVIKLVKGFWVAQYINHIERGGTVYIDPAHWHNTVEEAVAAAKAGLSKKYHYNLRQLDFILKEEI